MTKRTKLIGLLAAGLLTFGAYGLAMATTASDQGVTPTEHAGNITADGNGQSDKANCDAADAVETGDTTGSGTSDNGVTVDWTYDPDTKALSFTATGGLVTIAYVKGGDAYNEYDYVTALGHGVSSDGNLFAPDNGSNGPAGLSHAVFCTGASEESQPPSFGGSVADITDQPTEPNTATIGTGNGGPTDSSWLFVAAIGVLLASVVVMTPARAKSRR